MDRREQIADHSRFIEFAEFERTGFLRWSLTGAETGSGRRKRKARDSGEDDETVTRRAEYRESPDSMSG